MGITPRVQDLLKSRDYTGALGILAGLREPIDIFFEQVKVMDDDEQIKNNRLALLKQLQGVAAEIAAVDKIVMPKLAKK